MWGPFGVCSGTCDITATHNRTRNYTGGTMPCAGNSIEVAIGCQGEHCSITLHCSQKLVSFQLREYGEAGVHMEHAQELVTALQLIAEQETIQGELCHVRAVPQKFLSAVKVRNMIFSKTLVISRCIIVMNIFQLREHGEIGILGEPVLVHVIVQHLKIGQEPSQVAQYHVQAMQLKLLLAAQVKY